MPNLKDLKNRINSVKKTEQITKAMRMEKAYKSGHEITNEVTLAEAGLHRFSRDEGFQGAETSLKEPERWVVAYLKLEEPSEGQPLADPLGSESVWRGGRCVGTISSGGYGHAEGAWLGWAYVKPEAAAPGSSLEVMTLGSLRRAEVLAHPVFDPENERPRS